MSRLFAVAASDFRHVTRLVTLLRDVTLLAAVAAFPAAALGAILGKVTDCND